MSEGSPATAAAPMAPVSKKPDDTSAFKQQRMPSWQPVMSPEWVIAIFILISVIFVTIGVVVIVESDDIKEVKARYDQLQSCSGSANCINRVPINIPKTMSPPILMYYQIDNFYQNHRRYAKSRSDLQLAGEDPGSDLSDCDPILTPGAYKSIGSTTVSLTNGETVNVGGLNYNPCGLIAWSMFNDTYTLTRSTGEVICNGSLFTAAGEAVGPAQPCEKKGIAWPSDAGVKYNSAPQVQDTPTSAPKYFGHQGFTINANMSNEIDRAVVNGWYLGEEGHKIPDPTDLDLMVWMRLASLSTFRKLYRKINIELKEGTYDVIINDRFPVSSFKGKKYFVLTTTSWLGGKNHVLGGLYIATGVICMLLGLGFLAKHFTTPRRVGL